MSTAGRVDHMNAQATIEELRYWAPSVKDVAKVDEFAEEGGWRLFIIPHLATACPVELFLRSDGLFDIDIAGQSYSGLKVTGRTMLVAVLDAIAAGRVVQRQHRSAATGAPVAIETRVMLTGGQVWRQGPEVAAAAAERGETRERHFLPYRR